MSAGTRPASSISTPLPPKLTPLGEQVAVRLLPPPPVESPIHYTPTSLTQRAVVTAVGGLVPDLREGMVVFCRPMQGHEVGDLLLLPSAAILASETQ